MCPLYFIDQATNTIIEEILAIDAYGNLKSKKAGNGVTTSRGYDTLGRVTSITTQYASQSIQNLNYIYDTVGNLKSRDDARDPGNVFYEEFSYDKVNRLKTVSAKTGSMSLIQTMGFDYDEGGRITNFNGNIYHYTKNSNHGVDSITGTMNKAFDYDTNGNQTNSDGRLIHYTAFNKTSHMQKGVSSVDFIYGTDNKRIKRIDIGDTENETTYYVGNVEFIFKATGNIQSKRYIGDAVITQYNDEILEFKYLHKDHLGSIQSVTSENYEPLSTQHLSYDAFGRRRDASNNSTIISFNPIANVSKRGFTGQEHVDQLGIINYNARLYDPELGIMLQADTIIPDGPVTQSLNRYSYVFNNPLSYTDPTGHAPNGYNQFRDNINWLDQTRRESEEKRNKKAQDNVTQNLVKDGSTSKPEGVNGGTFRGNGLGILANPDEGTQVTVTGSNDPADKLKTQKVTGHWSKSTHNASKGYSSPEDAVIEFYKAYENEFKYSLGNKKNKVKKGEIAGMVFENNGKYYFSNAINVPTKFDGSFTLDKGIKATDIRATMHSHADKSTFNGLDYLNQLAFNSPNYVRNRSGDIFRWDVAGAQKYADDLASINNKSSVSPFKSVFSARDRANYQISKVCNSCLLEYDRKGNLK